ncbi:MAG: NAD(P)/FAD-dependent oxidoreductase [Firmicutes bacterium]|nr:NAD(P)/FAD-dependent oxidoreductase [Bacillota bacterium]
MPVQIVVLGAGPGGLAAAHEGIRHGHNVTLVDPEGLGGNALKHSLIPSKVLIQAAETLNRAGEWGARWDASSWQAIMEVQTRLINDAERDAKRLLSQARVIAEFAHLASARHVVTDTSHTVLEADVIVIAIGSRQRLIPGMKPDGRRVLLPRIFHTLSALPDRLAIIGGGATGLESASLFSQFGVKVDLFVDQDRLLPQYDPEIAAQFAGLLQERGVTIHWRRRIQSLEEAGDDGVRLRWIGEGAGEEVVPRVLLATGRMPMWEREPLERLGFSLDAAGFFEVSSAGRTSVENVYAVGDAASGLQLASRAWRGGQTAIRDWLGLTESSQTGPLVEAIYTRPELARVGISTSQRYVAEINRPWLYQSVLTAGQASRLVLYAHEDGRVAGVEALGPQAAEVVSTVAMAMHAGMAVHQLVSMGAASPTSAEWLGTLMPE